MTRDRDDRKTIVPPAKVRAQTAPPLRDGGGDFEGNTPVDSAPEESRAKVGDVHQAKAEIMAKVETYFEKDELQHQEIRTEVAGLRAELGETNKGLADQRVDSARQFGELRVEGVKQNLSLDALVRESNISDERKRALELAKDEVEIRDRADRRLKNRDIWYSIGKKIAVGLLGLALVVATHYVEQCRMPSPHASAAPAVDAGTRR